MTGTHGPAALLAVDWGTSSLRGALLARDGQVVDTLSAPRGLLSVPAGGWGTVFNEVFGPWLARDAALPVLMSGMVGSRQGWSEAPYCGCPADAAALVAALHPLRAAPVAEGTAAKSTPRRIAIVPGVSVQQDGAWDVMRGEETQVLGALALLGLGQAEAVTVLLPGTHSKWVQVQRGRITGLRTHMTGECFALFRQHSILARTLPPLDAPAAADGPSATPPAAALSQAFADGIARAREPGGLLHHLFGVRTQALLTSADPAVLLAQLSGLVIGEELRAQAPTADTPLVLVGDEALVARYQAALAVWGLQARTVTHDATWHGLLTLAQRAGWC